MSTDGQLRRELGIFGATMMGLGAMVGTGVFVSIGIAAGIAGPAVILAILLAAVVAACNALNSAQLAASLPVSGGSYEYGYAYLAPWLGFTAGWVFLFAKTASAATAVLGFAGYVLQPFGGGRFAAPLAVVAVVALTTIVLAGIRRSNLTNVVIVSITIVSLLTFIAAGGISVLSQGSASWQPFFAEGSGGPAPGFLQATALMFVAFTGYARLATLGEEVREPRRTIPRAIMATVAVAALIYIAVGVTGIATIGAVNLADATQTVTAPLAVAAQAFGGPVVGGIVALGAITAMLGVALNLILGLSRMALAMGRRRDMPSALARIDAGGSPRIAIVAVGIAIAALTLVGDVRTTWSFSAFNVLIYYAITNLAALRLPPEKRLYPRAIAWAGLAACLFLAFWVEREIWLLGLALIAAGLVWRAVAARLAGS